MYSYSYVNVIIDQTGYNVTSYEKHYPGSFTGLLEPYIWNQNVNTEKMMNSQSSTY